MRPIDADALEPAGLLDWNRQPETAVSLSDIETAPTISCKNCRYKRSKDDRCWKCGGANFESRGHE